ncbi:MAG: major capsid protein [Fimbriimonadaceae bacterium]|nr:major capsid protein [Fimbriimonadaceae bacterium]QYK56661.1 MAG: major capsid protein [Fimbriimonadaceae bacterium]
MAYTLSELLSVNRISRIIDDVYDRRGAQLPAAAQRVLNVDADEDEITAKVTGLIVAADIIADDGKARVRGTEPLRLTQTKVPNLKIGMNFSQGKLNLLNRLQSQSLPGDLQSFDSYMMRSLRAILDGVEARRAALVCAMMSDVGTYNAFGIQFTNMSWGMPANLKTTLAGNRRWIAGNEATALPVTDIREMRDTAIQQYGIRYDRVTMSAAKLQFMASTTEFRNLAAVVRQLDLPVGFNFNTLELGPLRQVVGAVLDIDIEVEDAVYFVENEDGTQTSSRYFNAADVILSVKAFDGNTSVWDFANAVVTESIVGNKANVALVGGGFASPVRGPVGYGTGSPDLNPPNITLWGVQRGFPRKHMETATARISTE